MRNLVENSVRPYYPISADSTEEEIRSLMLGCMINFVILAVAGMAWDGAAMRRKQGPEP